MDLRRVASSSENVTPADASCAVPPGLDAAAVLAGGEPGGGEGGEGLPVTPGVTVGRSITLRVLARCSRLANRLRCLLS